MRAVSRVVVLLVFTGKEAEATLQMLDQTLPTLMPADIRNNPRFQSAVLAELIEAVGEEYGEAVEGGKLVNLVEYQDAVGYLQGVRMTPSPREFVSGFCASAYELERGL
jgi:hypothetical protein